MDKLKMQSVDGVARNIDKILELFPNAETEILQDGKPTRAVDFDVLKQELAYSIIEGPEERYQFTWPDKRETMLKANLPIPAALRPVYNDVECDGKKIRGSVGRDGTIGGFDSENLYIEGDNLEVLKILREAYLRKVKMIYIDPPYNTGKNFIYNDNFAQSTEEYMENSGQLDEQGNRMEENLETNGRFHTDWLNMIYPRLRIAKDLMSDDGFIAISIGEEEDYNLIKICNEIFGTQNFRNKIALRRYDKNLNLQFVSEGLSTMNIGLEYILIYSKSSETKMTAIYKESTEERSKFGYWKGFWNNADRPTMRYALLGVEPSEGQWKWKKDIADEAVQNYITYQQNFAAKMSIEEYWRITGKQKRFIRRNLSGSGRNQGVEHWIPPTDGILRNSNWSDLLVSKPIGMDMVFDNPKNPDVLIELIKLFGISYNDIVLDFFSGSATTAHAVMQINAEDGGKRKFIMVQIPEICKENSDEFKAGYENICEIGKERIRRAGKKIKEENPLTTQDLDVGFRCLRLDTSNMKDVYYRPEKLRQSDLFAAVDNVKEDRSPEDLLFQVMPELCADFSSKIEEKKFGGKKVFCVEDNYLVACFDNDVADETVSAMAKMKPQYAVLRDKSMKDDSVAVNFEQIFKTYSPDTELRVL